MIRQAAFKGLREDKPAHQVVAETPTPVGDAQTPNETLADSAAATRRATRRKLYVRRRIQIEHQPAGNVRLPGGAVPRVYFERAYLRDCGERLDAVDLYVGGTIALDLDQFEQVGHSRHGVPLEELLPGESIRCSDEGAGPALQMRQHPRPHHLEVAGEVQLGHRLTVARIGPERFVRLRNRDAHDDRGFRDRCGFHRRGRDRLCGGARRG